MNFECVGATCGRPRAFTERPYSCGGSNLSTDLLLWGIYIKKCISPVRIRLQTGKPRNASTKFRKTSESKKAEKSLEISAFLVFSCLHLNQTRIMAGVAGFEPTNDGVRVRCLFYKNLHITHYIVFYYKLKSIYCMISTIIIFSPNLVPTSPFLF